MDNMKRLNSSLDHLFRHEYSKLVALLAGKYAARNIDLIEDAVQDALLKAMQVWSYHHSIPDNPTAWLYRVANNRLIDLLRRQKFQVDVNHEIFLNAGADPALPDFDQVLPDEMLTMIFACCHPSLAETEQIMLSLKLLGGLSVREIAASLFKKEAAVKKVIYRAKQKFKSKSIELQPPDNTDLAKRLQVVLKVLYLMFNEGYKATEGNQLIKKEICEEAIRLAYLLHQHRFQETPHLNALLALMCFNAARFDTRIDDKGNLLTLAHQQRKKWDQEYIRWGLHFQQLSARGREISEYHLEAGIASLYVTAPSFPETDWPAILLHYDALIQHNPSPVIALNRAVVLGKVEGPEKALAAISELEARPGLQKHHLLYSIKADLLLLQEKHQSAAALLTRAIDLTGNAIEKRFLRNKLAEISI